MPLHFESPSLHCYWLSFSSKNSDGDGVMIGQPQQIGIGVTAYSKEDALRLIEIAAFTRLPRKIEDANWSEITEPDQLDQKHVVPNAGPMYFRGVWYPNVFTELK